MAKETATITFTLEDEFSAKMQEIVGKLEDFRRRMSNAADRGSKGFQTVTKEVEGIGQKLGGVETRLHGMATFMKTAFDNFTKSLQTTHAELGKVEKGMMATGGVITQVANAMKGTPGIIAGIGAAATSASLGFYALGRSLSESYQQAKLLRTELGEQ